MSIRAKSVLPKGSVRKKNVSKDQISVPIGFEHVAHTDPSEAKRFLEELGARGDHDYSTIKIKKGEASEDDDSPPANQRARSTLPWINTSTLKKPVSPVVSNGNIFSDEEEDDGDEDTPQFSERTEEKVIVAKIWMENYFDRLNTTAMDRENRKERLEQQLAQSTLNDDQRESMRLRLLQKESDYTRLRRKKVTTESFDDIKIIGRGAFGLVKLIVEKESNQLYAMKVIRKSEVIKKKQEGHIRAERDILASASHLEPIVKLYHSFQDKENLYFVMEYMAGGDLLNLLIKKDIFPEIFARFYAAEMVLAIDTVHSLGYIHRDIKPDNFLFTSSGHLKVSDFGLCTGFHWAHDAKFYEAQRRIALKKMTKQVSELKADGKPDNFIDENAEPKDNILRYREQNKRQLAFSVVGTNNYIAPEVLLQVGYNRECDWWSFGVILFETIFGYPPFCSENRQTTKLKIINWQKTFRFPQKPKVSDDVKDLISKLICDPQDRLGRNGADEVKKHPFFKTIDWDNLYRQQPPWVPELTSPTDTSCFDEIKPPDWSKSSGDIEDPDYNLYGFTYRGFYNLTRKGEGEEEDGTKKMDPLQAAVLAMLEEDAKGMQDESEKRRSRSSTF